MSLTDVKLHLVDSIDDVLAMHEWLGQRRPYHALAFDTETTGLKIGNDIVRVVQVGDGEHGWAMPWSNEVGAGGAFIGGWAGAFTDVVRRWDGLWLAHNAKFDVGMLDHMRVNMPRARVHDTRIMTHCLTPQYSTALKNVAARLVDAHARDLQEALHGTSWSWATVPVDFQPYWTYAALDAVLTYRVYEVLWPQVQVDCPVAFDLENSVSWAIECMERRGTHVDVEFAAQKYAEFGRYVRDVETWCVASYGVRPGSNAAVVQILQEAGHEFSKTTKTGAVALDEEVIGDVDHPLARAVLSRRKIQKLASTYLRHFVEDHDEDDLIHPTINVLGARTSRMSMEGPNLQNLPRKSNSHPAAEVVRSCVSAREGHTLLMCDFDQVEMRMLASMARDRSMIEAFGSDDDFFVTLAHMVYSDETIVKSDPRRQIVKNAGYSTIYGSGVEKFARTAGIPFEQGQAVRNRWNTLFPEVTRFQRTVIQRAQERLRTEGTAYVRCPVTNRRQVADPGKEYALVNYMIQGAAAAVFKRKILELDAAGLGDWMTIPVHDEIILDVPDEHVSDVAATLRSVMNDDTMFEVPITASVSYGRTWSSKEEWK